MQPHSKSIAELGALAETYYQEIKTVLPKAVSFQELFEIKAINTPKNHKSEEERIDRVVRKSDFYSLLKSSCITGLQSKMPDKNTALSGLYLFSEGGIPVYFGISRNVFKRLSQHAFGKTHYSASLAYRIEKDGKELEELKKLKNRNELDFSISQTRIRNEFKVNVFPISDPYELYWMEVTLAGMFGTKYNEFETH